MPLWGVYIPEFHKIFSFFGRAYAPTYSPILAKFGIEEWTGHGGQILPKSVQRVAPAGQKN